MTKKKKVSKRELKKKYWRGGGPSRRLTFPQNRTIELGTYGSSKLTRSQKRMLKIAESWNDSSEDSESELGVNDPKTEETVTTADGEGEAGVVKKKNGRKNNKKKKNKKNKKNKKKKTTRACTGKWFKSEDGGGYGDGGAPAPPLIGA